MSPGATVVVAVPDAGRQLPGQPRWALMSSLDGPVSLRPIDTGDLEIFFAHQLDPEATRMASFPSRGRTAFFAHWTAHILGNPAANNRTILLDQRVVGHIGAWTDATAGERLLCYWLGREFWGRGIASAATRLFLGMEVARPLVARVARHNAGSIRVLERVGFVRLGEESFAQTDGTSHQEHVYVLREWASGVGEPDEAQRGGV